MKIIITFFILCVVFCYNVPAQTVLPDGNHLGKAWIQDSVVDISWMPKMISSEKYSRNVDILLWNAVDNSYTPIANKVNDTVGYHSWRIPKNFRLGNKYKVMIRHSDSTHFYMMSADFISIYDREPDGIYASVESKDIAKENSYIIFPNPTNGNVNIKSLDGMISVIEVYNLEGKIIKTFSGITSNDYMFQVDDIEKGTLFVRIVSSSGRAEIYPLIHIR